LRRLLATAAVIACAGAFVVLATGAGNDNAAGKYWVELDNAFGLIKGGDLKIAGVRAGKITDLKVDRDTHRALVQFQVTKTGFGSLRTDVHCETRPQSLIGEYFVDCLPGTAPNEIKPGSTIPVSHTGSTVPPDLVNNILRKPYAARLSIILSELGAGVAGNSENLNSAIRRANPALRETDQVLHTLAQQNKVLANLARDGDTVVGDLADNRKDVSRWVREAGNTATISAERRNDIALGFKRLPAFLEELKPTMAALGRVAKAQTPALKNLNTSAQQLDTFFTQLKPFAEVSRPATRALGQASKTGEAAAKSAAEPVDLLNKFAKGAPELGKNLAIILEHLDNRDFAAEEDKDSPGGKGFTGIEALLEYVFDQVQSINIFDSNVHILKVAVFESDCADYADIEAAKPLLKQCGATLGPNQPGFNYPDWTATAKARAKDKDKQRKSKTPTALGPLKAPSLNTPQAPKPAVPKLPPIKLPPVLPKLPPVLPKIGDVLTGKSPLGLAARSRTRSRRTQTQLLDYLFAP
jgi:ABC-type transporter Mla subunit MlaD